MPVLVSSGLSTASRVMVFFGERHLPPGILSWRVLGEEGIKVGSILQFAEAVTNNDNEKTAMVVANPCQLLWYRGGSRAVSDTEWLDLPRPSAGHEAMRVDPVKNRIPHNHDYGEHVRYVLGVLPQVLSEHVKIDIVGVEYPGSAVVEYLAENCNRPSFSPASSPPDVTLTDA